MNETAGHRERRNEVLGASRFEKLVLLSHLIALLVASANGGWGVGWPGLWWQVLGLVWGVTVAIGAARSITRRTHA